MNCLRMQKFASQLLTMNNPFQFVQIFTRLSIPRIHYNCFLLAFDYGIYVKDPTNWNLSFSCSFI